MVEVVSSFEEEEVSLGLFFLIGFDFCKEEEDSP